MQWLLSTTSKPGQAHERRRRIKTRQVITDCIAPGQCEDAVGIVLDFVANNGNKDDVNKEDKGGKYSGKYEDSK
jgi:hypothetical protein